MTKGFTLVEALVVISIIAILGAVLFPVLSTAKESAKQSACLTQLAQIGMATNLYADDYDQIYPCDMQPRVTPGTFSDTLLREFPADQSNRFDGHPVAQAVSTFVKDASIWFSPMQRRNVPENGPSTNYQANAFVFVNSINEAGRPHGGAVGVFDIESPARTMLWQNHFMQGQGAFRGGINRVAADAHSKWMPARRTGSQIQLRWWIP